jgi:hypothetical protein
VLSLSALFGVLNDVRFVSELGALGPLVDALLGCNSLRTAIEGDVETAFSAECDDDFTLVSCVSRCVFSAFAESWRFVLDRRLVGVTDFFAPALRNLTPKITRDSPPYADFLTLDRLRAIDVEC